MKKKDLIKKLKEVAAKLRVIEDGIEAMSCKMSILSSRMKAGSAQAIVAHSVAEVEALQMEVNEIQDCLKN